LLKISYMLCLRKYLYSGTSDCLRYWRMGHFKVGYLCRLSIPNMV
jgi:hypothetical protein